MTKDTFIMRTKIIEGGEGVPAEILDIIYDNIVTSEFTYAEHKDTTKVEKSWFSKLKGNDSNTSLSNGLLSDLTPRLEQLMPRENNYSYKQSDTPVPIKDVHLSLLKAKSLCLSGVRSAHNHPEDGNNTFVIRVTKAGIMDRKYDCVHGNKKSNIRGWRPFGVILSGSQIIFFSDLTSYQQWYDSQDDQPRPRDDNYPPVSSLTNLSINAPPSEASNDSDQPMDTHNNRSNEHINQTPIPNAQLRPVQIISLSYAICIYDKSYTKYPHVFRLITGDGQQFLLRAADDEDMNDWMLKINYAASLKTTGVRVKSSLRPNYALHSAVTREQMHNDDRLKRDIKVKEKVTELTIRIDEQIKSLRREHQLRKNLMVIVPHQKSTKDRLISFAEAVGKRIKNKRIELQRLRCYRDYLQSELEWYSSQKQSYQQLRKMSLPLPYNGVTQPTPLSQVPLSPCKSSNSYTDIKCITPLSERDLPEDEESDENKHSSDKMNEEDSVDEKDEVAMDTPNSTSDIMPQLPPFSFNHSFMDGMNLTGENRGRVSLSELDRTVRRRSQSNPILPHHRLLLGDKKNSLLDIPKSHMNRERSSSEESSVRYDDDNMSVIIVNETDELLD
ncbi:hypothetical protein BDB01DRAFT_721172 [Pilobolus umbonatus]|nr:hypothetical protein BDB01DRAFT_721172 [Pilobolus umbonatus]